MSSFINQVLLPAIEEIINAEVKKNQDKKVVDDFAKTKSGQVISKGKLNRYLLSGEGRLTITEPVIAIVRRLRIIGDTPRVNNKQKEQQINAVKKELSDDPEFPMSKRESKPIVERLMKLFLKDDTEPKEPKKPRGRPPKERGESAEETKRRIGRPRV